MSVHVLRYTFDDNNIGLGEGRKVIKPLIRRPAHLSPTAWHDHAKHVCKALDRAFRSGVEQGFADTQYCERCQRRVPGSEVTGGLHYCGHPTTTQVQDNG